MDRLRLRNSSDAGGLTRWGEIISPASNRIQVKGNDGAAFRGTIASSTMGPLRLLEVRAAPHRLVRSAGSGGAAVMPILLQSQGRAVVRQGGRSVHLKSGNWTAWSADRAHEIENLTDVEQYAVLVPVGWAGLQASDLRLLCGKVHGEGAGVAGLIFHHIRQLFVQAKGLSPSMHGDLADILAHLLRLALEEVRAKEGTLSMRDTFRARIEDYIRHNIRDPAFSLDSLADRFGCSKRHLHKIFSQDGVTLSQFVWNERIERCRADLEDPAQAGRSVTDIAFSWGFNNSSHFNKLFKERYGAPPGRWRLEKCAARKGKLPTPRICPPCPSSSAG